MPFTVANLTPACCSGTCPVCIDITSCGTAVPCDWGVYPSTDHSCTGTAIATGHYDGTAASCFNVPGVGTYDIQLTPTGAGSGVYRPRCTTLSVPDCGTVTAVDFPILPYLYTVPILVYGAPNAAGVSCNASIYDPIVPCYCPVPGATVRYEDGANDVTGTTDANGRVTFTGLDTVEPGTAYTITVSGLTGCGFDLPKGVSGTLSGSYWCAFAPSVHLDPAAGYTYGGSCWRPIPETAYVDAYGTTFTLTYQGNTGGTLYFSGYDVYEGCVGISCSNMAVPVICGGMWPVGEKFRCEGGHSGTVYVWMRLYLSSPANRWFDGNCDNPLTYTLEVAGWTCATNCDESGETVGEWLVYQVWHYKGSGSMDDPANWEYLTLDCAAGSPPLGIGVFARSTGSWSDLCDCGDWYHTGSFTETTGWHTDDGTLPCASSSWTVYS